VLYKTYRYHRVFFEEIRKMTFENTMEKDAKEGKKLAHFEHLLILPP